MFLKRAKKTIYTYNGLDVTDDIMNDRNPFGYCPALIEIKVDEVWCYV